MKPQYRYIPLDMVQFSKTSLYQTIQINNNQVPVPVLRNLYSILEEDFSRPLYF